MNKKMIIELLIATVLSCSGWGDTLANFDFENHTAGGTISAVGDKRLNDATKGDGYPFDNNVAAAHCSISTLTPSDTSVLDRTGANVRSDTLAAIVPGGNFLEISPSRLLDQSYVDIMPSASVHHYLFSIQPDEGYLMNLESFSFDCGVARGSSDTGNIQFSGQGWYSLDGGAIWTKMRDIRGVSDSIATNFSGFLTVSAALDGISDLQGQTGEVLIALSLRDNSGRNPYANVKTTDPAAVYLDNVTLDGVLFEDVTLPEGTLVVFDFENSTAGDLLAGAVGTPRSTSGVGDGFDFSNNGVASNLTASALSIVDASGDNHFDAIGANVRSDTLAATAPGGQFIEMSPWRLDSSAELLEEISPTGMVDHVLFDIQADAESVLNLDSFEFEMGIARGASDTNAIFLRAQGWYSLDAGSSWTSVAAMTVTSNITAQSFTGFIPVSLDLSSIADLQNQPNPIRVAIALNDNSGRNPYLSEESTDPAAFYLNDVVLNGTVTEAAPEVYVSDVSIEGSSIILTWDAASSLTYVVKTNGNLVSGSWGPLQGGLSTASNSVSFTTTVLSAEMLFYKVEIE
jgi:hypothetical protein